jgi:AcrR family transcriptional regulator
MQPGPRERLLDALIAHLAQEGIGDTSLRGLAAAVGSSHRMLAYHFGSRAGLLSAVAREVEARQRAGFAALLGDASLGPEEVMRRMWEVIADPALGTQERLFFELYGRALRDPGGAEGFLPEAIDAWLPLAAALFRRLGLGEEDAEAEARLALATSRGLLLDLLATGDRAAVDRAAERYLARLAT